MRDDYTHECPADGCTRQIPQKILACRYHWAKVSKATQRDVWAKWRGGPSDDYLDAHEQAVVEMNRSRPS